MLTAKYEGYCAKTGARILKGDIIKMVSRKAVLVERKSDYSDLIIIGANDYIRNARGKCIDAPCCGCCTI
jgi:hypothetical protein